MLHAAVQRAACKNAAVGASRLVGSEAIKFKLSILTVSRNLRALLVVACLAAPGHVVGGAQ